MTQLKVNKENIKAPQPLPEGIYEVRFEGFRPKMSSKGTSINLNPMFKVTDGPHAGRTVFAFINSSADWILQDFTHCFGVPFEVDAQGNLSLAGSLEPEGAPVEQQQYRGPLLGKTGKVMITVGEYQGKPNNQIKYYVCSIPDCNTRFPETRHSTNLL